jgi:hypothetical protein
MPKIYRGMKDDDGFPALGATGTTLGVRLPDSSRPEVQPDIVPDSTGRVSPGTGGMSVAPRAADLPPHTIPRRLKSRYSEAAGSDKLRIWSFGSGAFADGVLSDRLALRVDPENDKHGFVEPAKEMAIEEYLDGLAITRTSWTVSED